VGKATRARALMYVKCGYRHMCKQFCISFEVHALHFRPLPITRAPVRPRYRAPQMSGKMMWAAYGVAAAAAVAVLAWRAANPGVAVSKWGSSLSLSSRGQRSETTGPEAAAAAVAAAATVAARTAAVAAATARAAAAARGGEASTPATAGCKSGINSSREVQVPPSSSCSVDASTPPLNGCVASSLRPSANEMQSLPPPPPPLPGSGYPETLEP